MFGISPFWDPPLPSLRFWDWSITGFPRPVQIMFHRSTFVWVYPHPTRTTTRTMDIEIHEKNMGKSSRNAGLPCLSWFKSHLWCSMWYHLVSHSGDSWFLLHTKFSIKINYPIIFSIFLYHLKSHIIIGEFQDPKMEVRKRTIFLAIFCGDIPLHRPEK
jgi:hypothetical protein